MNLNPTVNNQSLDRFNIEINNNKLKTVTEESIYELLRDIKDPEHPLTLEQLDVIKLEHIQIKSIFYSGEGLNVGYPMKVIEIFFKPTVPHCSMAGIIGLSIKLLLQTFTEGHQIKVSILKDTHTNWESLTKQLNDKDRVLAASENSSLMTIITDCTRDVITKYFIN